MTYASKFMVTWNTPAFFLFEN